MCLFFRATKTGHRRRPYLQIRLLPYEITPDGKPPGVIVYFLNHIITRFYMFVSAFIVKYLSFNTKKYGHII